MTTPSASRSQHVRTVTLLLIILTCDVLGIAWLWAYMRTLLLAQILLFGFDVAEIAIIGLKTLFKYGAWGGVVCSL